MVECEVNKEEREFKMQMHHMWLTLLGLIIVGLQSYIASQSSAK